MTTEYQFQELCARLVQNEVHYTISNLVYTLAQAYGEGRGDLATLCEQAYELARPIEDWESAAIEEGWNKGDGDELGEFWKWDNPNDASGDKVVVNNWDTWEDLCREYDIEPQESEVYEHWIVSDWLADKLEAKGEKVDRDFAGLTIWARTTTGQSISIDYVIRQIVRELHNLDIKE